MREALPVNSTSIIRHVFCVDSTVSTGAGKTALLHSDITAYYVRAGGTLTPMTMETISTLGTWASTGNDYLGFKLLHDTNAPGLYELHLPNNVFVAGSDLVTIQLRATDMAPVNIGIPLQEAILEGLVDTTVAPSTTVFESDIITEATADHFIGRVVVFMSGALSRQATTITDYALNGGRGQFTVVALTEAPGNTDRFRIY
jgi:hypothetical protein